MSNGEDKKPDEPKQFEFSVGGYKVKYSNKLLAIIITVAPILGGSLWGVFTWYAEDVAFKKKVNNYVAPDLAPLETRLALVEETSTKTNDYTRDIKNDLKADIRKLEKVVDQVERDTKQARREQEQELKQFKRETNERIQKELSNPLAGN